MRPTTKDLAKAAGVSLATVDRVLNDRLGVKPHTIKAVHDAIERIGFVRNASAANLARSKTYRFLFLLPRSGDQFLDELILRIEEANAAFASEMVRAEVVRINESDPHHIANYLRGLSTDAVDGVAIMAPESPPVRDAMLRLSERGIGTVSFISGQAITAGGDFVGIDNHAAGATAGQLLGRFAGGRSGKVLVIAETMQSRDSLERRLGFDQVMTRHFANLAVLPSLETHGDPDRTQRIIRNSFLNHPDIIGVYVLSSEARRPLEAVATAQGHDQPIIIAHERTPFTEAALLDRQIDGVITQNPGHLVRSAIRILRARSEKRAPLASQEKIRIEIVLKENL
jgi:LacI family transcriptional regulator